MVVEVEMVTAVAILAEVKMAVEMVAIVTDMLTVIAKIDAMMEEVRSNHGGKSRRSC